MRGQTKSELGRRRVSKTEETVSIPIVTAHSDVPGHPDAFFTPAEEILLAQLNGRQ